MDGLKKQLSIQHKIEKRENRFLRYFYIFPVAFYLVVGVIMRLFKVGSSENVLSLTICALSLSAYLGVPQTVVDAKENGVLRGYETIGIPFWSLPVINAIISFIHMFIVSIFILVTAPFLLGVKFPSSIPLHIFAVIIIDLCLVAYGTLMSSLLNKKVFLIPAGVVLFVLTALYKGIIFTVDLIPKPIQVICQLLPFPNGLRLINDGRLAFFQFLFILVLTAGAFYGSYVMFRGISKKA